MALQPTACLANPQRHLEEGSLREPDAVCPLCGGKDRRAVYRIQDTPRVDLLHCSRCHGASASRMPTEAALRAYYAQYYDAEHSPTMTEQSVTMVGPDRLSRHIYRGTQPAQRGAVARIIDYGGGDGTIAHGIGHLMRGDGAKKVCIDVVEMQDRGGRARERGVVLRHRDRLEEVDPGGCEIVLASGILEHVPYPVEDLRGLLLHLKPGGLFYARTPYELPLIRLAGRFGKRLEMGFPGHVHDMGQPFWECLLEVQGLEGEFAIRRSKPSIVATTLRSHFFRTALAYTLKTPWYLLGRRWGLVGGWEVFIQRSR